MAYKMIKERSYQYHARESEGGAINSMQEDQKEELSKAYKRSYKITLIVETKNKFKIQIIVFNH